MNCEWVKSQVTLYAFDELSDPDRVEVEHHLARCEECARAAEAEKELRRLMNLRPRLEPSPALLAECRMALSERLEALPPRSPWAAWLHLLTDPFSGIQVQWKAGLALFLVSLGFSGGWFCPASLAARSAHSPSASRPITSSNRWLRFTC